MSDHPDGYDDLLQSFTRDLNRIVDADRNSRKRGLQKLLEELPWPSSVSGASSKALVSSSKTKKVSSTTKKKTDDKDLISIADKGKEDSKSTEGKKKKHNHAALNRFLEVNLLPLILPIVSDSVEKCREYSLQIIKKSLEVITDYPLALADTLVHAISRRIGENPIPEPAEELRLHCVECLTLLLTNHGCCSGQLSSSLVSMICVIVSKSLLDLFPAVKKESSDICILLCKEYRGVARLHFNSLASSVLPNFTHQHSKIRNVSIEAMGYLCSSITTEFPTFFQGHLLPVLNRLLLTEKLLSTRHAIVHFLQRVLLESEWRLPWLFQGSRSQEPLAEDIHYIATGVVNENEKDPLDRKTDDVMDVDNIDVTVSIVPEVERKLLEECDCQLLVMLLVLSGDDINEVSVEAEQAIATLAEANWKHSSSISENSTLHPPTLPFKTLYFLESNLAFLLQYLFHGISDWLIEARIKYLRGLSSLIVKLSPDGQLHCSQSTEAHQIPQLVNVLMSVMRENELSVRKEGFLVCESVGKYADLEQLLDILLPRVQGLVSGDTFTQKYSAALVLSHVLIGFSNRFRSEEEEHSSRTISLVHRITDIFLQTQLYEDREEVYRESLLLLLRSLLESFPFLIATQPALQEGFLAGALFLMSPLPALTHSSSMTQASMIPSAAAREVLKYSRILENPEVAGKACFETLRQEAHVLQRQAEKEESSRIEYTNRLQSSFQSHYQALFALLANSNPPPSLWKCDQFCPSAFRTLLLECPRYSWQSMKAILDIIEPLVQPTPFGKEAGHQDHLKSYASVRGEEDIPSLAAVDLRLSLLATLEGLFKQGNKDWECGSYIAVHASSILQRILLPNLIWRVGRVEATIRKVVLAACYALLKAGSLKPETLFHVAPQLVPPLLGNMDDSDVSARHLACLCLTLTFHRLRGAFGDEAVHTIYPKLLARLDDSEDVIRLAICDCLAAFLLCAPSTCFSGTTLEYTLDQLFIHLDDNNAEVQEAVYNVLKVSSTLDCNLVAKKASFHRSTHRNPKYCESLIRHCSSFGNE